MRGVYEQRVGHQRVAVEAAGLPVGPGARAAPHHRLLAPGVEVDVPVGPDDLLIQLAGGNQHGLRVGVIEDVPLEHQAGGVAREVRDVRLAGLAVDEHVVDDPVVLAALEHDAAVAVAVRDVVRHRVAAGKGIEVDAPGHEHGLGAVRGIADRVAHDVVGDDAAAAQLAVVLGDLDAPGVAGLQVRVQHAVVLDAVSQARVLQRDAVAGDVVDAVVGHEVLVGAGTL